MDNFIKLVDVLAWPVVVLVVFVLVRPQLEKMLGLIKTVKYKDAEVAFRSADRTTGDLAESASELLEQFWRPGNQRNLENEAILRKWLNSQGVTISITSFLNARHLNAKRRQAVEELKLVQPVTGNVSGG